VRCTSMPLQGTRKSAFRQHRNETLVPLNRLEKLSTARMAGSPWEIDFRFSSS
jgi:hypothetical protein